MRLQNDDYQKVQEELDRRIAALFHVPPSVFRNWKGAYVVSLRDRTEFVVRKLCAEEGC